MLRFGGNRGRGGAPPGDRGDRGDRGDPRAFPIGDINDAFCHLLRLINRVAALAGAGAELTSEIASLRGEAGRATLPEDYEHLAYQIRALELGPALSGLEMPDTGSILREAIDAAIPVARALGSEGPLMGLLRLRRDAEDPRQDLRKEFHAHLERLAETVGWLRAASDVFKVSTLDLIALLSRLSQNEHSTQVRLTQLRDGIERAGDLGQLQALRTALLREANQLVDEAAHRDTRIANVREQVDRVQAHVATLESALADAHEMARTDPLTALGNRRALEEHVAKLAQRDGRVGIVALDIDHFKRVNDTYGHDAGDLVIRRLADVLRIEIRGDDAAFRLGGEEFMVILAGTDASQAASVADRIRSRFAAEVVLFAAHEIVCTVSAGTAVWKAKQTFKQAALRADKLLYAAKQAGRNRVEVG